MTADRPTARVRLYETDPLQTFVERADEMDDYYEVPTRLLDAYEQAERARMAAVEAVAAYIRDNDIPKIDPMEDL